MTTLLFLVIGLAAGVLAGLFGIGGGVLIVPALWIAAGLFVGAYFGAKIAQQMSPLVLRRLFSVFLLFVAVRLWMEK